jgi:hypothetical protein
MKMESRRMREKPEQEVLEIFGLSPQNKRKRSAHRLKYKLREVVFGHRSALKVYSNTLRTDFWFVNEGLVDPSDAAFEGKAVTMEMLAKMLSGTGHLGQEIKQCAVGSWQYDE